MSETKVNSPARQQSCSLQPIQGDGPRRNFPWTFLVRVVIIGAAVVSATTASGRSIRNLEISPMADDLANDHLAARVQQRGVFDSW
jgi:hypothetical protein